MTLGELGMSGMEKTIKEMTVLRNWLLRMEEINAHGNGDMYHELGCTVYSALELLKEQEPKPVKVVKNAYNHEFYYCPRCDRSFYELYVKPKFCDKCGQAVQWT